MKNKIELRPYQKEAIEKALNYAKDPKHKGTGGMIVAPVGCHEKGYKVFKYDGTLINVEDVKIGDELRGIRGQKRIVKNTIQGVDDLFRITLENNVSFVVNIDHILHLEKFKDKVSLDISVRDYLNYSETQKKDWDIIVEKDGNRAFYRFNIEFERNDEYYGFTLDGDHLYIDENFIVQHNCGKSLLISNLAKELKGKTVVLQPSVELLEQNLEKLRFFGGDASVYSAKAGVKEMGDITYATIGSIYKIAKDFKKLGVKNVLIDEVNLYPPTKGSMFRTFIDTVKPDVMIGFTATPCRLYNMGDMKNKFSVLNFLTKRIAFDHPFMKNVIHTIQVKDIYENFWTPLMYEEHDFDEGKLKLNSTGAEYTEESIKKAIAEQGVNNNIYKRIKELNENGCTRILTFCDSIETAEKMVRKIPNSAVVTGKTPSKERAKIIKDFKEGKIWNVFNYGTLTSGFDYPELQAIIMGRPTNSYTVFYQALGRVVRKHPEKKIALVIDFCNNVKRFGKLEDLHIEYVRNFGWGMFTKNVLLTNTMMGGIPVTIESLRGDIDASKAFKDSGIKFWFGKHSDKKPSEVPIKYLNWIVENIKIDHRTDSRMESLIAECKRVINYSEKVKKATR